MELVDHCEGSLGICVVGDHQTLMLEHLDDLLSLRAWSRTHIQDFVMGLDIQEQRRKHAHQLLARYRTDLVSTVDPVMKTF